MPVYIYEEGAFEKFARAECGDNEDLVQEFMREHAEKMKNFSFHAFLAKWNELSKKNSDIKNDDTRAIDVGGGAKIRGLYGWNMYLVLHSGEIVLARPKEIRGAVLMRIQKTGFRTVDEVRRSGDA